MRGKSILPQATTIRFDEHLLWVDLTDGRTIGVPLVWFPRLLQGSATDRDDFFISPSGIHWETLDEDISIAQLLADQVGGLSLRAA
jgi:Protein of unknown function (DUF2442)